MKAILKIDNFSNYEIYPKEGKVWSNTTNKFIGSKTRKTGYWNSVLTADDGTIWKAPLHRVIYTACYGQIVDNMEVNHIDENPDNNSIFNLNLLTHNDNINWGNHNVKSAKARSAPVGAFKDNVLQFTFESVNDAGRNGYCKSHICNCCNGKRKSHKGYEWRYID